MPEGDSIHKLARRIGRELCGRQVVEARVEGQPIESFRSERVDRVFALGKHLFVQVGTGLLRTHLGMDGAWFRRSEGVAAARRVRTASAWIATADTAFVCTRAKEAEWLDSRTLRFRAFERELGVDLTADVCDLELAVARVRRSAPPSTIVCDVLLDQRAASGIGNVYKSEVLFLGGVHPLTPLGEVDDATITRLLGLARSLLRGNLVDGPRRTRALRPTHVKNGRSRDADDPWYWVYRRGSEPCLGCSARIMTARLGRNRRSTYWCSVCQPEPKGSQGHRIR